MVTKSSDSSQDEKRDSTAGLTDESQASKVPDMELAQFRFLMNNRYVDKDKKDWIWKECIMPKIRENTMTQFYREISEETLSQMDPAFVDTMRAENESKLKLIEDEIVDAEKNLGECEVRDALYKKAEYLCKIGDKDAALTAFRKAYEKTVGIGNQIDVILQLVRVGFFYHDHKLVQTNMAKVKELMEEGGDWDRRNRLRVYDALYLMSTRNFKKAARLFLEAVPTFSSSELFSYEDLVFYTVITCMLALNRNEIDEKIFRGSEIQEQLTGGGKDGSLALAKQFVTAFYEGKYSKFFTTLADIEVRKLRLDRYLAPHVAYYTRQMRLLAFRQFLAPYQSVSMSSMAMAFGVSHKYIDSQLHRLVASGDLHCRIDAVRGIVEVMRSDGKNDDYKKVISHGDMLLNRIQKLARVVNE